jgi:hypothetical protein
LPLPSQQNLANNAQELKPEIRCEKLAFYHLNSGLIWVNVHHLSLTRMGLSEYIVLLGIGFGEVTTGPSNSSLVGVFDGKS